MKIPANIKKIAVLACIFFLVSTATGCRMPMNEDGTIKLIEVSTTFGETMQNESFFAALLVWPMAQFLNHATPIMGVGAAIAVLTILVNALLMVFTIRSQIAQQQMQNIQPQLEKIQRKYEGKTDDASRMRQANEMQALYKKYNINPFGTILITFLQFPILISMYHAVQRAAVIKSTPFLGMDLNVSPMAGMRAGNFVYIILFIVMAGSQFLSMQLPQWLAKKKAEEEAAKHHRRPEVSSQQSQMQTMQYSMLLMICMFGLMWPAAMSVYWAIHSLVTVAKTLLVQKIIANKQA
ncbi:MAG: membrane protein insertase YidC [Solobacterium sp.]|nr:membrane protein insertase YidC [Solobacterium sp.]